MKTKNFQIVRTAVGISVFSALAVIVSLSFRFPVMFLTFDAKDAVIAIASFIYGPVAAILISFIAAFIELVLNLSGTLFYGFLMNFVSSATFAFVASIIYKYRRSFLGSIVGLYSAVFATTSVMMLMNILVTPHFMTNTTTWDVITMIPTVLLPFNFAKTLLNAAIAMLLYKPIISALRRAKLVRADESKFRFGYRTVIMIAASLLSIAVAVIIFVILNNAQ